MNAPISVDRSKLHSLQNPDLVEWVRARGMGGRVGFGNKPALVLIDVGAGWLDEKFLQGSSQPGVLESIVALLESARQNDVPRFFTTMGFQPNLSDCGDVWESKFRQLAKSHIIGSPEMTLHPALQHRDDEVLMVKPRQSGFFGTPLASHLILHQVDTIVVVGLSTSGCVRSTCEDGFNHNYRVIVPQEAVGDRTPTGHESALFDIDCRFGDVSTTQAALAAFTAFGDSR